MFAVIGRVKIHPGHEDETLAMIVNGGVPMVRAMAGSSDGYWLRSTQQGDLIQHSFWLFSSRGGGEQTYAAPSMLRPSMSLAVSTRYCGHVSP